MGAELLQSAGHKPKRSMSTLRHCGKLWRMNLLASPSLYHTTALFNSPPINVGFFFLPFSTIHRFSFSSPPTSLEVACATMFILLH